MKRDSAQFASARRGRRPATRKAATAGRSRHAVCTRIADSGPTEVAAFEDVTERVVTAEALARADRQRASILESISDAFAALDREGRFTYVNRRAAELLGRSAEQLLGRCLWDEVPESRERASYRACRQALAEGVKVETEEYHREPDRWYQSRIYPSDAGLAIYFTDITERKQSEALLIGQSRVQQMVLAGADLPETLAALLDVVEHGAPDTLASILLLDEDGVRLRHAVSRRLPEGFARAIDGARGGPWGAAAHRREPVLVEDTASDPLWRDHRELAIAHGLRASWSTPILDSEGRVLGTFALYFREPGRPSARRLGLIRTAAQTAALAIVEHRARAEGGRRDAALRTSESRLRTLFEQAADGIFILTPDHRYVDANREGLRMLGYTREELMSLRLPDVLAEHERPRLATEVPEMMAGTPHLAEWVHLRKDGSNFTAEVSARVLSGSEYLAIVRDTTARRLAEAAARAGERRLLAFMENVPGLVNIKDRDRRYVYANAAVAALFGRAPNELVGRRAEELMEGPEVDQNRALDEEVLATRRPNTTVIDSGQVGGERAFLSTKFPFPLADGSVAVGSIALDISAQRRAELEVRRLAAELEARVAERTAELAARNRELETFSYSVSHDLKAPLRGIDGYSRLLLDEHAHALDAEARGFLLNVRQATREMGRLIDDLLAYSRLERRPLQATRLELRRLVESLVADRADDARAAGASIDVAVPELDVRADPDGLAIALRNLVDNALKFTRGAPAPRIEIGARAGGRGCLVWVRDNGIGFDMKFHDRIFEVFQRLQRAEDYPGTGVGLAMVRRSLERMGGRVWADSAPGAGSTFFLELPRGEP